MRDREYNGWTNYETWLVNLWMDNEEGSQEFFREQAEDIYAEAKADTAGHAVWTPSETARFRFAAWLKDHHEEQRPELPGLYGDLLGGALSEVNWGEIARHYIEAVEEEANAKG
jgi:hypothetical protein